MPASAKLNPVEQRLMLLADRWMSFRKDPTKRLLVWQTDANANRFYQCFFEVQKHETAYTVGDLFVVFEVPFVNSIQYSRELKNSLVGQYAASRNDLVQQGISPDWEFSPREIPDSVAGFVHSLQSFGAQHHDRIGHLVAVLMPTAVADNESFVSWLMRVLNTQIPERLRFVVIDSLEAPRLNQGDYATHRLVHFDTPKINALVAAQETFAQENVTGPAGVFRNLFIGLMTLVEKGPINQVNVKAADAIKFARNQKWTDQEVAVTMLVAGALLREKRFDDALKGYRGAREAAMRADAESHPAGKKLVLQTWFGEAGVHLAAGEDQEAVQCYDQAATVAQQIPDLILGIEAFRMGAFCLARMNDLESAIRRGSTALILGERLRPEARCITTLPIAALDLLRLMEPERVARMEQIKYQQTAQIATARRQANQSAEKLEPTQDIQAFHAIENTLEKSKTLAEKTAAQQLEAIAAGSGKPFRETFYKARDLLGASWPFEILTGIPVTSEKGESSAP